MKKLLLATSIILVAGSANAVTLNAVRDNRGKPVYDSQSNCVRHEWEENTDVCAKAPTAPAPVPVVEAPPPVVSPAKQLKVEDRTVYFDFDKSMLTADAKTKLDSLANVLKSDTEVKSASIVGYADRMGSTEYNDKLSQKRAVEVQSYLAEKGYVKTEVAKTEWVGESQPKTTCAVDEKAVAKKGKKAKTKATTKRSETIACLAEDRRVEVKIDFVE